MDKKKMNAALNPYRSGSYGASFSLCIFFQLTTKKLLLAV